MWMAVGGESGSMLIYIAMKCLRIMFLFCVYACVCVYGHVRVCNICSHIEKCDRSGSLKAVVVWSCALAAFVMYLLQSFYPLIIQVNRPTHRKSLRVLFEATR